MKAFLRSRGRGALGVWSAGVISLLLAWPQLAGGHVLPGFFVLKRCQARVAQLTGLEVRWEVEQDGEFRQETLRFTPGGPDLGALSSRVGVTALGQLFGGGLTQLIRELRIDTGRTSLARLDGRVAVVLGAAAGETERPQLWVDQETFFPVRLVAGGRDLVLLELGSPQTFGRFPRTVQVREAGQLLWQARVVHLGPLP